MPPPELVLHVGLQQTGARMLLRALRRLAPQLRSHGVGLVGHDALADLDGLAGWRNHDDVDETAAPAFERGVAELVAAETAAVRRAGGTPRAIVLSSDHLLGEDNLDARDEETLRPLAEASVAQVIGAVAAPRTRLLLYVRRQDRLMEACYLRALQQGAVHDLGDHFPRRLAPRLDHLELVERLEAVDGVDEVRVRPFELVATSARGYAHDVGAALGLSGRLDLGAVGDDLTPYRLYSQRAAAIARDVNPYLDSAKQQRLVRTFLREHFPGTDDASTRLLPADERRAILAAHAPANHRLFERRMPDLPPDAYASDEATAGLAAVAPALPTWTRRRAVGARAGRLLRAVSRGTGARLRPERGGGRPDRPRASHAPGRR